MNSTLADGRDDENKFAVIEKRSLEGKFWRLDTNIDQQKT